MKSPPALVGHRIGSGAAPEGYADAREYDRGGYEVLWSNLLYFSSFGHVMPLNRDTAALLVRRISGTCTAVFSETKEDTGR